MTRGGKAPASPSLSGTHSSPHSGPGLEDAVKALGLAMSPAKGGPAGRTNVSKPQSRPLSPGQPIMGRSSPAYNLGEDVSSTVPGSYGVEGVGHDMGQSGQAGMSNQQEDLSGKGFDAFGDVLQPMNKTAGAEAPLPSRQAKPLGSDLDTSLASLASNLNMGAPGAPMMYQQPMGAPMGQPMMGMGQPPMGMMGMPMQPGMGMRGMMGGMPGGPPAMYNAQQPAMMGGFQPQRPPAPSNSGTGAVNDPFGALDEQKNRSGNTKDLNLGPLAPQSRVLETELSLRPY
ncbi:hypothetical protein EGW08_015227 [Elysia chlorotica]|uniref:Uncharacterized protein n=1 Tax=Elysia chlorotica TaxID=188477 RepID=A0A3S1B7L9_ELYCH|nr:hypothetical protein EGW08_015227 [Elysia chlorotica]